MKLFTRQCQNLDHHYQACFMFEPHTEQSCSWPRSFFFPRLFTLIHVRTSCGINFQVLPERFSRDSQKSLERFSFLKSGYHLLNSSFLASPCVSQFRSQRRWPSGGPTPVLASLLTALLLSIFRLLISAFVLLGRLEKYGVTIGCAVCSDVAVHGKTAKLCTDERRTRICEQMDHDPDDHERLQAGKRKPDAELDVEGDQVPVVREKM